MAKKSEQPSDFLFLPLGGSGEIGMNLNLYSYKDKWLIVDFGVTFGNDLGIEVILPDPEFIVERKKDLVGILLTHAHEDHIGALPYLWKYLQAPLYATPFTAYILREKLKDVGLLDQVKIIEIPLSGTIEINPFTIRLITLTHSIPEPNGVVIETPLGKVLHTGDWKLDPSPLIGNATDIKALQELGDQGVLAMICDSTNVFEPGTSGSEADVRKGLDAIIKDKKNAVVVTCFASNIARVESILLSAKEMGRKVCILGRSMIRMIEAAQSCGYLVDFPRITKNGAQEKISSPAENFFVSPREASNFPRSQILILTTGSQGEPRAALSRLAWNQHPEFSLEAGDSIIFSSRVIPGNERSIGSLQNALVYMGCEVITPSKLHGDIVLHVSGHPAREELSQMYQWVRPQLVIPVHGEARHLESQAELAKECQVPEVLIPANGSIVRLAPEKPEIIEHVHAGRLGMDGTVFVSMNSSLLKERRKMSSQGTAVVTISLDRYDEIAELPQTTLFGVVNEEETPERAKRLYDDIEKALLTAFKSLPEERREDDNAIKEALRVALRQAAYNRLGKKPLTAVHVVRLS